MKKIKDTLVIGEYIAQEKKEREIERLVSKGVLIERANEPGKYGYNVAALRKEARKQKVKKAAQAVYNKAYGLTKKAMESRLSYKPIVKKANVTYAVSVKNPETTDRSRFFKETWEEEKKSLFFK